jgi:D-serine deaminase-like pyridoxal phosphate-dependent protein
MVGVEKRLCERIRQMTLDGLRTPALILDSGTLRRNLATMSERIAGLGLDLRPHMKTSKCD